MKYTYLIIDATNLFYRCFKSLEIPSSRVSLNYFAPVIQEAIRRVSSLEELFTYKKEAHTVYLLFDNPLSTINLRKIISEGEYKSNRDLDDLPKGFYNSLRRFIEILKSYSNSYKIIQLRTSEADDLTYPLLKILDLSEQKQALCISADLDFARNINTYVHWFNYHEVFGIQEFKQKYGFSPEGRKVIMYKALRGDSTDCIPNAAPHVPNEIILDIIERFSTVRELFLNLSSMKYSMAVKTILRNNEQQLQINEQLVDFVPIDCNISDIIIDCNENKNSLRWEYKDLGIPQEEWFAYSDEIEREWWTKKLIIKKYQ